MISVNTNIDVIVKAKLAQIQELRSNPDPILRTVALTVMPALRKRVHVDGKDSNGSQIGTYSPGYMVVRTGAFKNAEKFSRGKKVGQQKNSGKFTAQAGERQGTPRPRYNRSSDPKVILSLTRQMENDLAVIDTAEGYGIGYLNPENFKKAQYCEQTYDKKILTKLTTEELQLAKETAQEFTAKYLKQKTST